MEQNLTPTKRTLTLTLNVIENRDSSFGNSKNLAADGCTCTCTCCCWGSGGGHGGPVEQPSPSGE